MVMLGINQVEHDCLAFHIIVTIRSPDQSRSGYSDGYRCNVGLEAAAHVE